MYRPLMTWLAGSTILMAGAPVLAGSGSIRVASVAADGEQGNGASLIPRLSGNGRFVAFQSGSTNFAPVDAASQSPPGTGLFRNIFLRDLKHGLTTLVSSAANGVPANSPSQTPAFSLSGGFVAFVSNASNLVPRPAPAPGAGQVFVKNLYTGRSQVASVSTAGSEGERTSSPFALSSLGRFVAFDSNSGNLAVPSTLGLGNVYVRDRVRGITTVETVAVDGGPANGPPLGPNTLSDGGFAVGGRFLAFDHGASNLVPGDDNGVADVFVRDRQRARTELISVAVDGTPGNGRSYIPVISGDGGYVVFGSFATNLTSDSDTNGTADLFLRDRRRGITTRILRAAGGGETNGPADPIALTPDGRYLLFLSQATNLGLNVGTTSITQVYRLDLRTRQVALVSHNVAGVPQNANPGPEGGISTNGRIVTFWSAADNLVPNDLNGQPDVFVRKISGQGVVAGAKPIAQLATGGTARAQIPSVGAAVIHGPTAALFVHGSCRVSGW